MFIPLKMAPYSYLNMEDWYRNISNAWKFREGGKNFAWCAQSLQDQRGSFKYQAKFSKQVWQPNLIIGFHLANLGLFPRDTLTKRRIDQEGYVRWSKKRSLANINPEEEQNVSEKRLTRATQVCVDVSSFIF